MNKIKLRLNRFPCKVLFGKIKNYRVISSSMPRIPLNKEFPFETPGIKQKIVPVEDEPVIRSLSNGIMASSKYTAEPIAALGVAVKPTWDIESPSFYGRSSFISSMPFSSTKTNTSFSVTQYFQRIGAQVNAETSRDGTMYTIEFLPQFLPSIVDIMSDFVYNAKYFIHEVNNAKFNYKENLKNITSEDRLNEDIHLAAFGQSGNGLPIYANSESLDKMTIAELNEFHSKMHAPERLSIACTGVRSELFFDSAERYFSPNVRKSSVSEANGRKESAGKYKGGEIRVYEEDRHKNTFLTIAFKTVGWDSKDIPAICVLGSLLGGGNSFSAGGPGKGMHSRLYTRMLSRNAGITSCNVVAHLNNQVSLFGISGSCEFSEARDFALMMIEEAKNMANPKLLTDEAFERAKNGALSTFLMNLENRQVLIEDYAKQLLYFKKIFPVSELKKKLASVTKNDVLKVASEMLKSKPSVVARGNTLDIPHYETIAKSLKQI